MIRRTLSNAVRLAAITAATLAAAPPVAAQADGSVDPSFGTAGFYDFTPFADGEARSVSATALAPDGRVVTVQYLGMTSTLDDTEMCRINANGNGRLCVDLTQNLGGDFADRPNDVLVQPDGKRVILGYAEKAVPAPGDTVYVGMVLRTTAVGDYDSTFSGDGRAPIEPVAGYGDIVLNAGALTSDGRIVVAGLTDDVADGYPYQGPTPFVARLTAAGALDTSFSGDGLLRLPHQLGGSDDRVVALAVQTDGRILLALQSKDGGTLDRRPVICRLTSNGSLDSSWDGDGCLEVTHNELFETLPEEIAVDRFGRVVLAGVGYTSTVYVGYGFVARYTPTGAPDTTLSGDGVLEFGMLDDDITQVSDLLLMPPPSDAIVLVGRFQISGDHLPFVVKATSSGTLDSSFSGDGKLALEIPGIAQSDVRIGGVVSQSGKLVVAGHLAGSNNHDRVWAGRLHQSAIFGDDFDAGHLDLWSAKATGQP
jgi:uncharacterized delta-60 repeat protein